jgi:hypothetical protein
MNWVSIVIACGLTLTVCGVILRYLRRRHADLPVIKIDLRPTVRISSFDGWASLELHLSNRSGFTVWIEEAQLVLTDLDAHFQTGLATGQTAHKIRQAIPPHETLSMSITGSLYEAAGKPQGPYSFLVLGSVHYRIAEEDWAEACIYQHKIEMTALSVLSCKRIRHKSTTVEPLSENKIVANSPTPESYAKETAEIEVAGR